MANRNCGSDARGRRIRSSGCLCLSLRRTLQRLNARIVAIDLLGGARDIDVAGQRGFEILHRREALGGANVQRLHQRGFGARFNLNPQIARAFELAYGRRATDEEIMRVRPIVERHGLAVFSRAVFNSNEFVYVD